MESAELCTDLTSNAENSAQKILWHGEIELPTEYLDVNRMLIYRGRFHLAHAKEIADSITACAVKNNLGISVHTETH